MRILRPWRIAVVGMAALATILVAPTPRAGGTAALFAAVGSTDPFSLTDDSGTRVSLFSPEACWAEFRYLRRVCHEVDLDGPARRMTGWQHEVPETQWPFMQFCYFG